MEPRIQYAQTKDGVSIAFWASGEGLPFVLSFPFSHVQQEWELPEYRQWHERMAEKWKIVRYDRRGCGLSDRDVTDYSLDALMMDLEAVVDRLRLERFALLGFTDMGPAAIAYAVRHPERVSHLVLWCSHARTSDAGSTELRGLRELLDTNWDLYTETLTHVAFGFSAGEEAHHFAAFMRECTTPEAMRAASTAWSEFDVTALLPQVQSPTLVLHRRQVPSAQVDNARRLAALIPGARLALLEGTSVIMYQGDMESVVAAIDEFLAPRKPAKPKTPKPAKPRKRKAAAPSGLVTILFTDMEGSTTLTQRLGDAKAHEVLRTHNTIVRDALKAHSGSEIKHTGDGIMASFPSASWALECAIAIQRVLAQHNEANPDRPIRVRIGLNAGEPVAEEEDLFGTAVQLAARICAQAQPGQILAPVVVRELAAGKGFLFSDRGDTALRGFEDPVRLYEVRWVA